MFIDWGSKKISILKKSLNSQFLLEIARNILSLKYKTLRSKDVFHALSMYCVVV